MKTKRTPWVTRFDGLLDRDGIALRAEVQACHVPGLATQPPHLALASLEQELSRLQVFSGVEVDILARLMERSQSYAIRAYPDLHVFLRRLHAEDIDILSPLPICLTGLAGVGKSSLLAAFARIQPGEELLHLGAPFVGGSVPSKAFTAVRVESRSGFVELLQPWLPPEYQQDGSQRSFEDGRLAAGRSGMSDTVRRAARYSYRTGVCASLVDEMQFMTQGATSNARVTQFLLMMTYLKVPLIFSANYSLCRKLLKRNQEDQDRLLGAPVVLSPLSLDDKGLGLLLRAYDIVLRDVVDGSLCRFMDEYAAMTLGIKRKVRQLTLASFALMRERGDRKLTARHLQDAFSKSVSPSFMTEIQVLKQQSIEGKPTQARPDLWCPFGPDFNCMELPQSGSANAKAKDVARVLMLDSLTASERRAFEGLKTDSKAGARRPASKRPPADVVALPAKRKGTISAGELLSNTLSNREG